MNKNIFKMKMIGIKMQDDFKAVDLLNLHKNTESIDGGDKVECQRDIADFLSKPNKKDGSCDNFTKVFEELKNINVYDTKMEDLKNMQSFVNRYGKFDGKNNEKEILSSEVSNKIGDYIKMTPQQQYDAKCKTKQEGFKKLMEDFNKQNS